MKFWSSPPLVALCVFALVLAAALALLGIHGSQRRGQLLHSFAALCEDAGSALEHRLQSLEEVVTSASAFAGRFDRMGREPWWFFAQSRRRTLDELNLPPVALLAWVPKSGLEAFVREVRSDGQPDYAPSFFDGQADTPHDDLFLVCFYAPWDGLTTIIGLDLGSEPKRRAALEKARDTGRPALAQDLSIHYGGKREPGTILMVPVYRRDASPASVEERRAALSGMVAAPIRMQWLREQIPNGLSKIACVELLRDGDRSFSGFTLCRGCEPDDPGRVLTVEHPVRFAGMTWRLQAKSRMGLLAPDLSWKNRLRLLGGGASAGVAGLLALFIAGSARRQAEQSRLAGEQLGRTLHLAEVVAISHDFSTGALQWQNELPRLFGLAEGETVSPRKLAARLHPDDRDRVLRELNATRADGVPFETAARVVAGDGSVKTLAGRGMLLRDERGVPSGLAGVIWDITARRRVAEATLRSETQYRILLDAAMDGVLILAPDGRIVSANPAACALFGFRDDAAQEGLSLESLLADRQPGGADPRAKLARSWEEARTRGHARLTLAMRRADDGAPLSAELVLGRAEGVSPPLRLATVRDISAQAAMERELLGQERVQQRLSAATLNATFTERKRLSAALHDQVSAPLERLEQDLARLAGEADPAAVAEQIAGVDRDLSALLKAAHALVYHLATPVLDRLGLAAALEDLCARPRAPGLPERLLSLRGDPSTLPPRTARLLFHAARELLANADRHARARSVRLDLRAGRRAAVLAVRDDGQGCPTSALGGFSSSGGFGLFSIRQRVATLGGRLRLASRPGRGACVLLRIPTPDAPP